MNRRISALGLIAIAALAACSSGSSKSAGTQPATTPTTSVAATTTSTPKPTTPDTQVWLCKPGKPDNPCATDLTATVVAPDGTMTVATPAAADPPIDCFYVYPTVSNQPAVNANLAIEDAEIGVAIAQAARFSQVCRVYAPMYRQVTINGLFTQTPAAGQLAAGDVRKAWNAYLTRYNDGRGVVLIGHSQGTFRLRELIAKHIEPDASVRARVVSAILLGGNVIVPEGKDVGGDFQHLGACRDVSQTGCVIAFSAFDHDPPANSLFAHPRNEGEQVLCTNPAALDGGSGPVMPYLPSIRTGGPFAFSTEPLAPTPWVSYPHLFTAECKNENGASWLQINDVREAGDDRPALRNALGPTWGLHLYDGNIALGNLVDIVRSQTAAYAAAN